MAAKNAKTSRKRKPKETVEETFVCPHCNQVISNDLVRSHMGKLGGKKLAEKGPKYFADLQARRKTRAGGRPPGKAKPKK